MILMNLYTVSAAMSFLTILDLLYLFRFRLTARSGQRVETIARLSASPPINQYASALTTKSRFYTERGNIFNIALTLSMHAVTFRTNLGAGIQVDTGVILGQIQNPHERK